MRTDDLIPNDEDSSIEDVIQDDYNGYQIVDTLEELKNPLFIGGSKDLDTSKGCKNCHHKIRLFFLFNQGKKPIIFLRTIFDQALRLIIVLPNFSRYALIWIICYNLFKNSTNTNLSASNS